MIWNAIWFLLGALCGGVAVAGLVLYAAASAKEKPYDRL